MNKDELVMELRKRVLDPLVFQVVSDARVIVDGEVLVLKTRGLNLDGVEFKHVSNPKISADELVGEFVVLDWNMFTVEGQRLLVEYQEYLRAGGITG